MTLRAFILSLVIFASGFSFAAAEVDPDQIVSPANRIDPNQTAGPWNSLLAELAKSHRLFATFTEHRYLPIKKVPVVFKGEVRLLPERGLSLHYISPEVRTLVIDRQGLLMRNDQGRTREAPSDPRAEAATSALLHVMRFDLAELSKVFHLYGVREGDDWTFVFDPQTPELAKSMHRLVVRGNKGILRRIGIRRSALQRVEITIEEVTENADFTPEEVKRFFR